MGRIGVFLCQCSLSPLQPVAGQQLRDVVAHYPGVVHAENCPDLCLSPGLEAVRNALPQYQLDGVVLASCSPALHLPAVGQAMVSAGLDSHQARLVELRPSGIWDPVTGGEASADEAARAIGDAVDDLREGRFGAAEAVPIKKKALVIGGGVAGIQAALDIADGGYQVVLVEKSPSIGGHMIQYAQVFPTLDCPQCILTPKMVEVGQHPNITLLTYAEVQRVSGTIGNFEVEIVQKARKVDHTVCNGCGTCWQKCPEKVPSEFDVGIGEQKAIYIPFAQAVPAKPVIDTRHCRYIKYLRFMESGVEGKKPPQCRICERLCPVGAIDWNEEAQTIIEEVGAIIVATGFELMPGTRLPEYAEDPDVIDGIQFERMLSAGGPTNGTVQRLSDGKIPKEVVFVSCAGSRDPEHGVPYCSRVCCMYLAKQAMLYKHAVPDGQAHVFYIDTRTTGKGYEEFLQRAVEEGALYLRGKVSRLFRDGDKLRVLGVDTLSGRQVEVACDLVVLGMATLPSPGAKDLAAKLGIATDEHGFVSESHAKLNPLETTRPGIYVAGMAQGPKDIPDAVAQGSGAASKVLGLFSRSEVIAEGPVVG